MTQKPPNSKRNKKGVSTSLGRAPSCPSEEVIDLSHVRKPIETSILGLTEVLRLFETATSEVRRYVAFECDLIYECRVCRTLFRSLANFVLHKRSFCTETSRSKVASESCKRFREDDNDFPPKTDCQNSIRKVGRPRKCKDLNAVLNRLYDRQESNTITEQCLTEEISNESCFTGKESVKDNVALEKLNCTNTGGVYQTIFSRLGNGDGKMDFMKTEVMEIHDILENNEAILGSDGKILTEKNSLLKNNYACKVCSQKFSTKKTLMYHIRYKHNGTRLIYPCTECAETFASAWCVFRHLYKVHQKSTTQVRKLRNLIHDSAIKRSEETDRKNSGVKGSSSGDLTEKQWMDNLEGDNDLQRCGGCGRKFERKAALHSHSQFCAKRISLCNSLKEIASKKEEKQLKVGKTNGVRRRKPIQIVHRISSCDYVKKETDNLVIKEEFPPQSVVNDDDDKSKDVKSDSEYPNTRSKSELVIQLVDVQKNKPPEIDIQDKSQTDAPRLHCDKQPKHTLEKKSAKYIDSDKRICLPCKRHFVTYKSLMKHMALHFNWYRYHCTICKYLSYTKSKCKHHITSKHQIADKRKLAKLVKRISGSRTQKTSTNFVKHYRKKTERPLKKIADVTENKTICENIKDPAVRNMVIEVIFGSSDATNKSPEETPQEMLSSRPIRMRTMPLRKDFLYETNQILKRKYKKAKLREVPAEVDSVEDVEAKHVTGDLA